MNFNDIKARYDAAFDAYNEIQQHNAQRAANGEKPSALDFERESKALGALNDARRELLAALEEPTGPNPGPR